MKNLFSVLLITTLAVASSLAAPDTPQGGVEAPVTNEEGALWQKERHHHHKERERPKPECEHECQRKCNDQCKDAEGPCNFDCDRVAVDVCVTNAGPDHRDACSDVFSCQHRCEEKFGGLVAREPCKKVCASSDCKERCINLRLSKELVSYDDDACEDVCGECFERCVDKFPADKFPSASANCAAGCELSDDCRYTCAETEKRCEHACERSCKNCGFNPAAVAPEEVVADSTVSEQVDSIAPAPAAQ